MNREADSIPVRASRPLLILKPRPPFDFAQTLRFILSPPALANGRAFEPLLDHFVDGEYRRLAEIGERQVLYGLRESREGKTPILNLRILSGPADAQTIELVLGLVRQQFATDLDLAPFYRLAARDRVLRKLAAEFRGMRIPQAPNIFECLVSAILEQQVNLSFAHQVKKALVDAFGSHIEFEGRRYSMFPSPAALAIVTPRDLRRLQISGPKARYIINLAQVTLDGTLDLEGLRQLEPAIARERLLHYKGVGPWTAQYVGMRALGQVDSLPSGDLGLQKVIQRFYGLRKRPLPAKIEKLARAWAGWRSYATFYLWLTYWQTSEWRTRLEVELKNQQAS